MTEKPGKSSLVDVALPLPVDKLFTYRCPRGLEEKISCGCRVTVPFGRRKLTGYAVSFPGQRGGVKFKLREIDKLVDPRPLLDENLMRLAEWMSRHYVHTMGEVLRAMLPASLKGEGRFKSEKDRDKFPSEIESPILNREQQEAFGRIKEAILKGENRVFLLHGVTGSGKTEVYLRAIEEALNRRKSALVLIPEIALIPQTTARFRRRFGDRVAVLHSRLTGAQRHTIWQRARRGEVSVVIGPRSAVFVPLENLSVIVVDEEQDNSFKQEEKPHYHAVSVAERRAELEKCVLVLGSATPSLESYGKANRGKIEYLQLRSRPLKKNMPDLELVDMRGKKELFSDELLSSLEGCINRGEQAIVLHNRRGHANYTQCRECGYIEKCPNCSISLTYHSRGHRLRCHYCDYEIKPPEKCRKCGEFAMRYAGSGTQRVEMELSNLLPGARIARMDFDTTRGKSGHRKVLETFSEEEANILLGTQMVAKGHHYPGVTVVGVLLADLGLGFPDYRAAERTFQLLYQAAGRTGRGKERGRVIVQTYSPENYVFKHLARFDFPGFAGVELDFRKDLGYPPAGELILLTLSSSSHSNVRKGAEKVAENLEKSCGTGIEILGPAPALIEKLRGKYRMHIIVRAKSLPDSGKREIIAESTRALSAIKRTDLQWDVDPLSIL